MAVGGAGRRRTTHEAPPKPLRWPTVSVAPSVVGRGTGTRGIRTAVVFSAESEAPDSLERLSMVPDSQKTKNGSAACEYSGGGEGDVCQRGVRVPAHARTPHRSSRSRVTDGASSAGMRGSNKGASRAGQTLGGRTAVLAPAPQAPRWRRTWRMVWLAACSRSRRAGACARQAGPVRVCTGCQYHVVGH